VLLRKVVHDRQQLLLHTPSTSCYYYWMHALLLLLLLSSSPYCACQHLRLLPLLRQPASACWLGCMVPKHGRKLSCCCCSGSQV
jgi:hypothetical protein